MFYIEKEQESIIMIDVDFQNGHRDLNNLCISAQRGRDATVIDSNEVFVRLHP
jgi:hypothetical protein